MKKNLLLKILVVILAGLIWIFQALLKNHQLEQEIPVNLYNIPEHLVQLQNNNLTIPVTFSGRGIDFLFLKMSKPFILIDASDYYFGENRIRIDDENLIFPERAKLEIEDLDSEEEHFIFLDRLLSVQLPLELQFATAADEEFFLENKIQNRDQRIEVKAPETILKNILTIRTRPISRKQVRDGKISVGLEKPLVQIQIMQENVILDVSQTKIINKTITLIPIEYPLDKNITIIPQKVSVMINGPKEIIEKLSQDSIRAFIKPKDLDKLSSNKPGSVTVDFTLPSGVKLIEYTPQRIQILHNE